MSFLFRKLYYICKKKDMEGCGNFRIIYSEETIEFLNRLEEKAKAKEIRRIYYKNKLQK